MLRIITFGGCLVRREDGTELPVPRRRMALLVSLAAAGSRGMTREKLLGLLWPELDDERGRAALSQALYALRKDLGAEEVITGTTELRLDPALVESDRAEFLRAIEEGEDARAVMLYRGPYLDGVYTRETPAFEQQLEIDRADLAARYAAALERLARGEGERGDHQAAVRLWRQRAALDPTDATIAVAVMRAQAAAGDRAGALRHAEVYAELLKNSMDLAPDERVLRAAAEIRGGAKGGSAISDRMIPAGSVPPAIVVDRVGPRPKHGAPATGYRLALIATLLLAGILVLTKFLLPTTRHDARVIAVTEIQDFAGDSLTGPLAELLRSSLANIPGLSVVSAERMAEGRAHDSTTGALAIARGAGASEAVNGALFRSPDGTLRFDLRRVDPVDGRLLEAMTVEGRDVFALTSEATRRLTERYGVRAATGEVAAVTSNSLTAIRLYQAGLDAWYRQDASGAYHLFDEAAREDTSFAMGEFYAAWLAPNDSIRNVRLDRAHQLGLHASLREHLIIDVNRSDWQTDPGTLALAESLTTLFPQEMAGPFALGRSKIFQIGDFLGGIKVYRDALRRDPVPFTEFGRQCDVCTLRSGEITAWIFADSFPAAKRTALEWTRDYPRDPSGWRYLALVGELGGDSALWRDSYERVVTLDPNEPRLKGEFWGAFYLGQIPRADSILTVWMGSARPEEMVDLYWILSQLRREEGRPRAAMAAMVESRKRMGAKLPYEAIYQAQTQFDAGEYAKAVALYDSVARVQSPIPSRFARGTTWILTLRATPLTALGDTAGFAAIADSLRRLSLGSGFARDQRLYHHILGLAAVARGNDPLAVEEFRQALWSATAGYTRTNLELGRALLRLHRPREAAGICGAGLRAEMSASAQYVSRGELRECVARGWLAAGERDSARVYLRQLATAWANAEPGWAVKRDSVAAMLGMIDTKK